ncbi:MAG: TolC family protein [Chloroherpetonaceae bacterium]|nr:TolC family protein [Chloroherpetonaceae bacterium]
MRQLGQRSFFLNKSASDSLSLNAFLDAVLLANPQSLAASLETRFGDAQLLGAQGGFDPFFNADYERKTKAGTATVDFINAGVELPIATLFGPKLFAKYTRGIGSRIDNQFRTEEDGEASFGLKLPLFQGIFTDKRRASLAKGEISKERAEYLKQELQFDLLLAASSVYWDWSEAYAQYDVIEKLFNIATERARAITERARRGESAAIDTIEALQEVEKRRGDMLKARRKAESSSIKLSIFLWNEDGSQRPLNAAPYALPAVFQLTSAEIERDRNQVLKRRPEAFQLELDIQAANVDLDFSREFLRPNISAEIQAMQYKFNSIGLTDYKVGLNISQPLFFREASAQEELAQIKVQRTVLKRLELERKILAEVDDAISELNRALERIDAAEREVKYAQLVQQGELRRFTAGESSLLILNLRERATATAQSGLVSAKADYFRALSLYLWSTGRAAEKWFLP